jgi:hypothetical protein
MVTILMTLRRANTEYMEMLHTSDHGLTTLCLLMVELSTVTVSKSYLSLEAPKLLAITLGCIEVSKGRQGGATAVQTIH